MATDPPSIMFILEVMPEHEDKHVSDLVYFNIKQRLQARSLEPSHLPPLVARRAKYLEISQFLTYPIHEHVTEDG